MHLVDCTIPLPPTLGAMLLTMDELAEFVFFLIGNGFGQLIYGDRKKRRTRRGGGKTGG